MCRDDPDGHRDVREQLVSYCIRLLEDGLAVGSAGNMSVRAGDTVLITPSGTAYREMSAADICVVGLDGTPLGGPAEPSSETPMHLAIYASTRAAAVVHTHSPEVIALSAVCDELPAIHYAIVGLGGPVRVAPYARFGSAGLARAAVAALDGRSAAILGNHGAVSYGATLAQAYDRALLLEWLAQVHRLACSRGEPRILTEAELDEVAAEVRRRRYDHPLHHLLPDDGRLRQQACRPGQQSRRVLAGAVGVAGHRLRPGLQRADHVRGPRSAGQAARSGGQAEDAGGIAAQGRGHLRGGAAGVEQDLLERAGVALHAGHPGPVGAEHHRVGEAPQR